MDLSRVLEKVAAYATSTVCVTGGEPLAQKNCAFLLTALCDAGYSVSLETSGSLDIGPVDERVSRIVDVKTPGSGEVAANRWENLDLLRTQDELKFVLCDEADYRWASRLIAERHLPERCPVLFSPVADELEPGVLADWILRDRLPVRMQMQLHKILWGNARGK